MFASLRTHGIFIAMYGVLERPHKLCHMSGLNKNQVASPLSSKNLETQFIIIGILLISKQENNASYFLLP